MFGDPQIARELVEARIDGARRYAADRRRAGLPRRRAGGRHGRGARLRMLWTPWFGRGSGRVPAPKPTTA